MVVSTQAGQVWDGLSVYYVRSDRQRESTSYYYYEPSYFSTFYRVEDCPTELNYGTHLIFRWPASFPTRFFTINNMNFSFNWASLLSSLVAPTFDAPL